MKPTVVLVAICAAVASAAVAPVRSTPLNPHTSHPFDRYPGCSVRYDPIQPHGSWSTRSANCDTLGRLLEEQLRRGRVRLQRQQVRLHPQEGHNKEVEAVPLGPLHHGRVHQDQEHGNGDV